MTLACTCCGKGYDAHHATRCPACYEADIRALAEALEEACAGFACEGDRGTARRLGAVLYRPGVMAVMEHKP